MNGVTIILLLTAGVKGKAEPPAIARVSMAAAGATAVNSELWINFEDFLRAYDETLRSIEMNDSPHVLLLPLSIPSFLTFSIIKGVRISK